MKTERLGNKVFSKNAEEGIKMYQYKTEILKVSMKVFSDKANEKDIAELDELINQRAQEGWELATYDYMATSVQVQGAFVITFKKQI